MKLSRSFWSIDVLVFYSVRSSSAAFIHQGSPIDKPHYIALMELLSCFLYALFCSPRSQYVVYSIPSWANRASLSHNKNSANCNSHVQADSERQVLHIYYPAPYTTSACWDTTSFARRCWVSIHSLDTQDLHWTPAPVDVHDHTIFC